MKKLLLLTLLTALTACESTGKGSSVQHTAIPGSKYLQINNGSFDRIVIHDKNVFAKYDKIIFSSLKFDKFTVKPNADNRINRSWVLESADKFAYDGYFKDEVLRIFDDGHAAEVFGLGAGKDTRTLYAEVRLLELDPLVAKYGAEDVGPAGRKSVISLGSLTIQILLVDSVTNEFVAVIEDGRDLAVGISGTTQTNKATDAHVWKQAFHIWLSRLKETATQLKTGV